MIRLVAALLSRRPRPSRGGAAAPTPVEDTPTWHIQEAVELIIVAHEAFSRRGRRANPGDVAFLARHAAAHLIAFASGLEEQPGRVDVPDDLSDLDEGDM